MTTIAVVVPARDAEATLPATLAALAAQRRAPDEVVVVDDGSARPVEAPGVREKICSGVPFG